MTRTPAKTKSLKQRLNRLARQKARANGLQFRRRNLAICTALGTAITFVISSIPLECSKVYIALDYPTIEVVIQLRLTLEKVKYCEATQEQSHRVEKENIEE